MRKPSIFEVNILYLVLGILLLYVGYLVQSREIFSGLLITEYILILLPNILYLKLRGFSLKSVLRLNPITLKQAIIIILIMLFAYPVVVFFNALFLAFLSNYSSTVPSTIPIPTNAYEFIIGILVIAISPGVCEEIMFRGTIYSAYEKLGNVKSIIITSVLFGLFHFNIFNFIGPTFLAIILSIILIKTNSIISSILGHILNNSIALIIGYIITNYSSEIDEYAINYTYVPEFNKVIMSLVFMAIIAIISSIILIWLIKRLPASEKMDYSFDLHNITFVKESFIFIRYIPVAIIFVIYIVLNYKLLFNV